MSLKNDKKNNKKLDKKLDNNDKINNKKSEKNDSPKEEMTKGEKLFFRILLGIGALLIVLIIIFSIGTGGDKNMIARKYNSITNENVFDMIDYDDLIEKNLERTIKILNSIADKIIFLLFVRLNLVIIKSPLLLMELPR